jgi:hypothetical protein
VEKAEKGEVKKDYRFIIAVVITLGYFVTLFFALFLEANSGGDYFEKVSERLTSSIMIILGYYFLSQKDSGGGFK